MEVSPDFDTTCGICMALVDLPEQYYLPSKERILYSGIYRTPLSSFAALNDSVDRGCHLCYLIYDSLKPTKDGIDLNSIAFEEIQLSIFLHKNHFQYNILGIYSAVSVLEGDVAFSAVGAREISNAFGNRSILSKSLHSSSVDQINAWMASCLTNHTICRNSWRLDSLQRKLPTRLLEISFVNESTSLRLVLCEKMPVSTTYFTLSHCWGLKQHLRLLCESLSSYCKSIPLEFLSQTFRDAVEVTRQLGGKYLWVDSLCIIQDLEEDWLRESSRMGEIYAHGILNLAATSSKDGDGGLFYRQRSLSTRPCIVIPKDGNAIGIYPSFAWSKQVEGAPLAKRAWVTQERTLSPRVLHFGSGQLYWECCESMLTELGPTDRHLGCWDELKTWPDWAPNLETQKLEYRAAVIHKWCITIYYYSKCDLTIKSDKLVAISGIAQRTSQLLRLHANEYFAGLWKTTLPSALLWYGVQDTAHTRVCGRAPSWSWASVDGQLYPGDRAHDYQQQGLIKIHQYGHVLDIQTDHDGNPFGAVTGGRIRLQAPLCQIQLVDKTSESMVWEVEPTDYRGQYIPLQIPEHLIGLDADEDWPIARKNPLFFLLIEVRKDPSKIECVGLVLYPTNKKKGQFQRLGIIGSYVGNLENLIQIATNPEVLSEEYYESASPKDGFIIEII